ncbi:uncharacterized protein LOC132698154 isoform X2 [Cylas formicarius]|nr:uncharacterized protein LOC132698154 isoform X2 [Cylas formicarius]
MLTFLHTECKKPPGYVEKPKEYDPNPPNYQFGYRIETKKGNQGRDEKREGIFAEGRYYVQNPDSNHDVKYFTDNWGYHPIVEYSNTGPHSKSSASFILDEEALKYKKSGKIADKEALMENAKGQQSHRPTENRNQPVQEDPTRLKLEDKPMEDPAVVQVDAGKPIQNIIDENPVTQPESDPAEKNESSEPEISQPIQTPICCSEQQRSNKTVCCFSQYKQPQFILLLAKSAPASPKILELLQGEYFQQSDSSLTNSVEKSEKNIDRSFDKHDDHQNMLIESTKNMVTGADVIDINEAANGKEESLQKLMKKHATPAILKASNSNATLAQPIVVAESAEEKPVIEKSSEDVLVTHSTKFLAPITAGIQLHHAEPLTENAKQTEDRTAGKVAIEVQKSMPYYLGKYEYPVEYLVEGKNDGKTSAEVKASEDIELGKTLLYFTDAKAEKLTQGISEKSEITKTDPMPILMRKTNPQAYSVVEKSVHIPVPVTKYIDRPYPVKVPYPHYQPQVENIIKEHYPLEVKIPTGKKNFINRHYHAQEQSATQWPQVYYVNLPWHQTHDSELIQNIHQQTQQHSNIVYYLNHPVSYAPQPPKPKLKVNHNGYLPPQDCVHQQPVYKNEFNLKNADEYAWLTPPKYSSKYGRQLGRSYRQARSNFDAKSIKMEYGFMPPLIPSLEIDEQGQPLEKSERI